jgi:hypothetical protein
MKMKSITTAVTLLAALLLITTVVRGAITM